MFWLWLIVAAILFAISMFVLGYLDDNDGAGGVLADFLLGTRDRKNTSEVVNNRKVGLFWCAFIGSLLWPIVLTTVLIFGPFVGFYYLGNRKRLQKEKSTTNK